MINKRFNLLFVLVLIAAASIFFGCKKKTEESKAVITVKGSDTMVNLSQKWAEVYMKNNPNTSIQVNGGGSGTGIAALLNGTTDLANSSREMKSNELEKAKSLNIEPKQYEVALDGIAVIVHPGNKINELTIEQIANIFTGKIKNWKDIGGSDMPITLYGRENSSGTYEFFKEHVLGKDKAGKERDYSSSTQVLQGTSALGEAVARDDKGIGYGGVGYFALRSDVKIIGVKKDKNTQAYLPAANNNVNYELIWNNSYPISRYLYCYTDGKAEGEVKSFIDFIISHEGQELVKQMEYIPLPESKVVNN